MDRDGGVMGMLMPSTRPILQGNKDMGGWGCLERPPAIKLPY